jgi:iron complex outermembrane recepter protein
MKISLGFARVALCALLALPVFAAVQSAPLLAQSSSTLSGAVLDPRGVPLPGAAVEVKNEATGATLKMTSNNVGKYSFAGLAAGKYTIQVDAPGFNTSVRTGVQVAAGQPAEVAITLALSNVSEQITVEASEANSVAAAMAPMDALLSETSARTEITSAMIQNFMSPVADYGEAVQMAPGTFTLNSNGVGLGQSKTYFRGFPDGDYDIDFDGIPFYDTNSPTHHSWAFFPTQWLGGIDFDRSPGTASSIGPTPFGGAIHLLSKPFNPLQDIRGEFSAGSFGTYLYDGQYDSGAFGPGHKFSLTLDVHHMQSNGYQTFNHQTQNGGDIQVQYKLSDKIIITGFSGVIWQDANTPNFNATRCQMYGAQAGYTCTGTLAPFAGAGINFLLTDNSDPVNYLDNQYNQYHIPTDFEYVGVHSELGHRFTLDIKPYTYNYDNSEKYSNAVPITEATTINGSSTYAPLDLPIQPCNVIISKANKTTGIFTSAEPCAVDKYNSYRKYGETSEISQVSKLGILRAGAWYEWAATNRHQYPSDPLNNWADQQLPNFAEKFVTNSYQPFVEYQFHVTPKLNITPGVKFAYYTIGTQQFADNGKTLGNLGTGPINNSSGNPKAFVANGGSYYATLPSIDLNYRLRSNWSAYVQVAQGSVVPPSSVFDYNQGTSGSNIPVNTLPKQQKNTTYQTGTVVKLKNVTFDADYYHIHFDNGYSSISNASTGGEPVFFIQPSSITQGVEGESNIYFSHGLSLYLNASYDKATYEGTLNVSCTGTAATGCTAATPQLTVTAPSGLNVQQSPTDIEAQGLTYQHKALDLGFFNKRVGTEYIDNGAYHNQATVAPFSQANAYFNYTIRSGGRFDQTKLRLDFTNIFNSQNVTGVTPTGALQNVNLSANNATYVDPFNTNGQTPLAGGDNVGILAGRSVALTLIFGFGPKR